MVLQQHVLTLSCNSTRLHGKSYYWDCVHLHKVHIPKTNTRCVLYSYMWGFPNVQQCNIVLVLGICTLTFFQGAFLVKKVENKM